MNFQEILDSRNSRLPEYSYKLAGSQYGMDSVFVTDPGIDEKRMSLKFPFASGERRDGVGDLLEVGGIDTSRHRVNPLCLFDHAKAVSLPIGIAQDPDSGLYTVEIDPIAKVASLTCFFYQGKKGLRNDETGVVSKGREFEHALFCEQLFDLATKKFIRAGSIGYQVTSAREMYPDYEYGIPKGLHLLKTLMLEGSLVVLPANGDTVRKMLALPECCGKPLSPYLVKSLTPYAAETKAVVVGGFDVKAVPHTSGDAPTGLEDTSITQSYDSGTQVSASDGKDRIFKSIRRKYRAKAKDEWQGVAPGICKRCMGTGELRERDFTGKEHVRVCPSCGGSKKEKPKQPPRKSLRQKYRAKAQPSDDISQKSMVSVRINDSVMLEDGTSGTVIRVSKAKKTADVEVFSGSEAGGGRGGGKVISDVPWDKLTWHLSKGTKAQPSDDITPEKAKQVLKDGEVRGHKLTAKQRAMFGAAAGKGAPYPIERTGPNRPSRRFSTGGSTAYTENVTGFQVGESVVAQRAFAESDRYAQGQIERGQQFATTGDRMRITAVDGMNITLRRSDGQEATFHGPPVRVVKSITNIRRKYREKRLDVRFFADRVQARQFVRILRKSTIAGVKNLLKIHC